MDFFQIFSIVSGIASIVSLFVALSAKSEVKKISTHNQFQSGINNKQAGRDIR